MKKILKTIAFTICATSVFAQPLGTPPAYANNPNQAVNTANFAWFRGGNFPGGPAGGNNIFGTMWNSAIYTQTDGQNRMKLNGSINYPVGTIVGNRSGFLLLTNNPNITINNGTSPGLMSSNYGAHTLLHLVGDDGNNLQTLAYRDWMRNGITISNNFDAGFIGVRKMPNLVGGTDDVSDFVINWSDNLGQNPAYRSPDNLVFCFTQDNGSGNNDLTGNHPLGRETMRHTADGNVGIGPRFSNTAQPQNYLHINGENFKPTYMQVTNQNATGQTGGDGFLFGVTNSGIAEIIQKENQDFRFYTNNLQRAVINNNGWIGFNALAPNNELEITSRGGTSPTPYGLTGSGLRFTNLTSANATIPNGTNGVNSLKVLTVDQNGDVVLTDGSVAPTSNNGISVTTAGVLQLGVDCNASVIDKINNRLQTDRMINMAGRNMIFADGGRLGIGMGITNCTVGNKVEIQSGLGMPYWPVVITNGSSGLRLTGLTSLKTPLANGVNGVNNTKVLSVDQNGDVVLVNANTGSSLGNLCSATPNPIAGNYEIPLAIHNFYYSGQAIAKSNVGIGFPCSSQLAAKLHVYQTVNSFLFNTTQGYSIAGRFDNYAAGPNTILGYGVVGNAAGAGTSLNIGVYGSASGGTTNYAGYFNNDVFINGAGVSPGSGLIFSDKNLKQNVVTITKPLDLLLKLRPVSYNLNNSYAPQLNVDVTKTYGLIAQEVVGVIPELVKDVIVPPTYDSLGAVISPSVSLKSLNYTGLIPLTITAIQDIDSRQNQMQASLDKAGLSDAQVKTNVNSFNALAKIKTLSPVKYNFTNTNVPQLNFTPNTDYGFIAQQLQTVYPELVDTVHIPAKRDSAGNVVNVAKTLKTVNYKAMSALLVRAVQELQFKVDSLNNKLNVKDSLQDARLTAIENRLNQCCSNTGARSANPTINSLDIDLSDKDAIVLNQNVPNPFAEQTTITYNVPEKVGKAQILFFNAAGQIIQTVDVKTRGKGKINVFASDLSSGLYHYSLVADGVIIDSKKMVRE